MSDTPDVKGQSITQMANSRQEKIAKYKEQKEQERRLKVKKQKSFLRFSLKSGTSTAFWAITCLMLDTCVSKFL